MMKKILITGGSGLVGSGLSRVLLQRGYSVVHLSRKENLMGEIPVFSWDIEKKYLDKRALEGVTDVVHLAGAGIADEKWTDTRKQLLIDSRVKSAELLFNALQAEGNKINSCVGASAIGFYGAKTTDHIFKEEDPSGNDFLARCCRLWEKSYDAFEKAGIRTVIIRTGVVLSAHGGAIKKIAAPVRFGVGAVLGSGRQYVPWIHENDLHRIYLQAIEKESMRGIYNAVASAPCTNEELTRVIAAVLHKKLWLPPVPSFVLHMLLGELSVMVLEGSRVSSNKIIASGFQFHYPQLAMAVQQVLRDSN